MQSDDIDGLGPGAHGTEGVARHRKNSGRQSNTGAGSDHPSTPAYTEEQYEAVRRCKLSYILN